MHREYFPYFAAGKVIKGFGRGSRELGFPTANLSEEVTESLPQSFQCGIYFGWAQVDQGDVYEFVMSVGFNPFYKNTKKTMEVHILHDFNCDLYGRLLKICITGYIREERDFKSADELINEIKNDIRLASHFLENPEFHIFKNHEFFHSVT